MAEQSFAKKLISSITGIVFGIALFLGSFAVLFYTEGRTNYSDIAKKAVPVAEMTEEKDFGYVTGDLSTEELLGDDFLFEDEYIAIKRKVEVYAWEEDVTTENEVDYYSYSLDWVSEPQDSYEFSEPYGHENIQKGIQDAEKTVMEAKIGSYDVDIDSLRLPGFEPLKLNETNTYVDPLTSEIVSNEYLYIGRSGYGFPQVGDMRVSYSVLPSGKKVTVFGDLEGNELSAHYGEDEKKLFRAFYGNVDDAYSKLESEYKAMGWALRILGFLMMWIGLMMIIRPVTVLLDLIPVLGGVGKFLFSLITFIIALVLSAIISATSMVLHNIIGIVVIIVVIGVILYFIVSKKKQGSSPKGPGANVSSGSDKKSETKK